jgi:hypothetical protein
VADLDARDLIEQDMAVHEARYGAGGEVHALRNQSLAAQALEQLDRETARAVPVPPPVVPVAPEREVQTRTVNGVTYTLDKAPSEANMYRSATAFEANVMKHAMPRVELLLSKYESGPLGTPSWNQRTLAALYFKIKAIEALKQNKASEADVFERAYQQDLYELLEASNASFGDWRKAAPAAPLIIGA